MLETVVVESSTPLTLRITDVDPNEILVLKSISGLTSPKAGLFTGDYASEGSYYQGRRGEKLNPVLTLKLNPDYMNNVSVSYLRERLYRSFFEPQHDSDGVKIRLVDDELPDRYFVGFTEDINTDQFSKDTSVQISMRTMNAYLLSYDAISGSDANGWVSLPLVYDGSYRAGLEATIKVVTATNVLTLDLNGEKMILNRAFTAGQIVTINTRKGERAIKVNGVDIMASLSSASEWLQFDRQTNLLKSYGTVSGDGKAVITSYNFRSQWWGI